MSQEKRKSLNTYSIKKDTLENIDLILPSHILLQEMLGIVIFLWEALDL
jgi:hypothetical protein